MINNQSGGTITNASGAYIYNESSATINIDDELQTRYEYLAGRNTEGLLNSEEQIELASLVRANTLLSVLKAEARAFLQHPTAA